MSTYSARFSVASVVVVVESTQESVKTDSKLSPLPSTTIESKGLPAVPDEDDEMDSDSDGEGSRVRKDSGYVDALETHDVLDSDKQVGVVESMSLLALNHAGSQVV
jgi:hypothetical protein